MNTGIVIVPGSKGSEYRVNLDAISCSCPNWRNNRTKFDEDDPRRLCKHLISAICDNGLVGEFPDADLEALAMQGKGFPLPKAAKPFKAPTYMENLLNAKLTENDVTRFRELLGGGGHDGWQNFLLYSKNIHCTFHCPEGTHDRWRLIMLADTGLIQRGLEIEPANLLTGFPMPTLRKFVKDSGITQKFSTKKQGIDIVLAETEWTTIFAATGESPDDFFYLPMLTIDDLRS